MPGIPATAGAPALLAQDSPLQSWFSNWLAYLSDNLPMVFLIVVVLGGIIAIAKGGIKQAVIFAVGAALAFLLLTNLESVAAFLREELPFDSAPGAPSPPEPTADPTTEPAD